MSFLRLLGKALRQDPIMGLVVVFYWALSLFYFFPLVSPEVLENLAWYLWDPALLTLALITITHGLRQYETSSGQRFWFLVSLALGFWLSASLVTSVLHLLYTSQWISILVDILYLAYYLFLILASDLRPDIQRRLERLDPDHRIDNIAAVGLCFTLLGYFVLIPNHLDLGELSTMRSSVLLYLGLDVVLLVRFASLAADAQDNRWRLVYRILAAGMLFSAILVGLELLAFFPNSPIPSATGSLWDLLWFLPFLSYILAARLPRQMKVTVQEPPQEAQDFKRRRSTWGPALLYALLLPCAHLVLHHIGWIDAPSQRAREALAILSFVVFGVLALVQYNRREMARQRAQKSLRASEHRYRQLVESTPDGILVEQAGRVVYTNPAARELLGEERLAEGSNLATLGLPKPSPEKFLELLAPTSPATLPIEHHLVDRNNRALDVEVSYLWIRYRGRLACQAILRDITALRALREEAESMERLAALGEFAATIAHEIRNPLASLVFNTRYLSERMPMDPTDREELAELEQAIDRMQTTVTRVLELSRAEQPSDAVKILPTR